MQLFSRGSSELRHKACVFFPLLERVERRIRAEPCLERRRDTDGERNSWDASFRWLAVERESTIGYLYRFNTRDRSYTRYFHRYRCIFANSIENSTRPKFRFPIKMARFLKCDVRQLIPSFMFRHASFPPEWVKLNSAIDKTVYIDIYVSRIILT